MAPQLHTPPAPELRTSDFWGAQRSAVVLNLLNTAGHIALSDLAIRIVGEEGTGKQQLARLIHQQSSRLHSGFHQINCAQVSHPDPSVVFFGNEAGGDGGEAERGILEAAVGGTLYIESYDVLPPVTQRKLFRALEVRHFRRNGGTRDIHLNARIITGLDRRPDSQARSAESAYELPGIVNPVCLNIPPLRERREDIESLIYLFLGVYSGNSGMKVSQITSDALTVCRYYEWPGNIDELESVIKHSVVRCKGDTLEATHLPEYLCDNHGGFRRPRTMTAVPR